MKADIQPFDKAIDSNEEHYSTRKPKYNNGIENFENLELPQHYNSWKKISINEGHYTTRFHLNYHTTSPKQDLKSEEAMDQLVNKASEFVLAFNNFK